MFTQQHWTFCWLAYWSYGRNSYVCLSVPYGTTAAADSHMDWRRLGAIPGIGPAGTYWQPSIGPLDPKSITTTSTRAIVALHGRGLHSGTLPSHLAAF
jgi:hypothetical protein